MHAYIKIGSPNDEAPIGWRYAVIEACTATERLLKRLNEVALTSHGWQSLALDSKVVFAVVWLIFHNLGGGFRLTETDRM